MFVANDSCRRLSSEPESNVFFDIIQKENLNKFPPRHNSNTLCWSSVDIIYGSS